MTKKLSKEEIKKLPRLERKRYMKEQKYNEKKEAKYPKDEGGIGWIAVGDGLNTGIVGGLDFDITTPF